MKIRLEYTSGIPSREVDTGDRTVEQYLFAEFGTRLNFENLGGRVIIGEAEPAPQEAPAVEEAAPVPKPKKRKAAQVEA